MSSNIRTRALAAILAVATSTLLLAAGPAQAAASARNDSGGGDVCWSESETATVQCFADESALAEAVLEQTGSVLVAEGSDHASRSSAGLRATYVLARLYEHVSYGGSAYLVTSGSSATCTTGAGLSANLPGAWNDRVSSFKSYYSCSTRIWENSGQSGAWFGYSVNAPGVGALDDEASSYRVL